MEPSRIHELNKLAGEFCGLELTEVGGAWLHTTKLCGVPHYRKWDPSDDHNDAAEVKAKLREKECFYDCFWDRSKHHVNIKDEVCCLDVWGHDKSELIALLLAVEALGRDQS